MTANRISGLFMAVFGLALYFVIIPYDTETVGGGWVRPQTVPNFTAIVLVFAGVLHAAWPTGSTALDPGGAWRSALFLLLAWAAVYGLGRFSFLWVAPAYVLLQMLLIGERRLHWYVVGVVVIPVVIWFLTERVLDRSLP